MSAFIVEDKTINVIANWINRVQSGGWYLREAALDANDPATVGAALFSLNIQAVEARYGQGEAAAFRPLDYHWTPLQFASPVATYKAIQCLLYQCGEGKVPETPLYQALEKLARSLAHEIISGLPGYDNAPWN